MNNEINEIDEEFNDEKIKKLVIEIVNLVKSNQNSVNPKNGVQLAEIIKKQIIDREVK